MKNKNKVFFFGLINFQVEVILVAKMTKEKFIETSQWTKSLTLNGGRSFSILKVCRTCSGVFPRIKSATVLQAISSKTVIPR